MAYNYPDLDQDDMNRAYKEAEKNVETIREEIAQYYLLEVTSLKHHHYVDYCKDVLDVEFAKYNFKDKAANIIAGSLLVQGEDKIIGINGTMNGGRQRFTELHEICHLFFDIDTEASGQNFTELLSNENYNPSEQFREAVANFGASMMLIPEEAMFKSILEKRDLQQGFSMQFGSSYSANFTRLRDYLMIGLKISSYHAYDMIRDYSENRDKSRLYEIFKKAYDADENVRATINKTSCSDLILNF